MSKKASEPERGEPWIPFEHRINQDEPYMHVGEQHYTHARLCVNACHEAGIRNPEALGELVEWAKHPGHLRYQIDIARILSKLGVPR